MKKASFRLNLPTLLALLACIFLALPMVAKGHEYRTISDIPYTDNSETDAYRRERCRLDLYYPTDVKDFPTVVWFHGGGLEGGNKYIPELLKGQGIGVVAVNYRLSPKAKNPAYIMDAAKAVAWTMKHITDYGGNASKIFVSGHSAGGYLSLMLALDSKWLAAEGVSADSIAAYLPVSGQTVTHFTIRKERGLPNGIPIVDESAPINHARKNTPPIILITGDRTKEMASRWEENAWLESVLKSIGNQKVELYELQGFDHGTVHDPALILIQERIKKIK